MTWHVVIKNTLNQLPLNEQQDNAHEIYNNLSALGWSFLACMAALGNMTHESGGLNPGQVEGGRPIPVAGTVKYGGGLGLIQWTDYPRPYSATYNHPLLWNAVRLGQPWYSGTFQCSLLNMCTDPAAINTDPAAGGSTWGWLDMSQYGPYPGMSFDAFKQISGNNVDYAAEIFYYCMEMHGPDDGTLSMRKQYARYWYDYFIGTSPDPPAPDPPGPDPDPPIPVDDEETRHNWVYYLPHPNYRV